MPSQTNKQESDRSDVPEEFLCPITRDIMEHPIMNREGRNFDRSAMVSWMKESSLCPLTREPIKLSSFVTNHHLALQIKRWREQHGIATDSTKDTETDDEDSMHGMHMVPEDTTERFQREYNAKCSASESRDPQSSVRKGMKFFKRVFTSSTA